MPDYSPLNLSQAVLLDDDKKQIVKENANIDWNRDTLMKWYRLMKEKSASMRENPILPSSPKTFSF